MPASTQLKAQVRWNMNRGCELVAQGIGDLFHAATRRGVSGSYAATALSRYPGSNGARVSMAGSARKGDGEISMASQAEFVPLNGDYLTSGLMATQPTVVEVITSSSRPLDD